MWKYAQIVPEDAVKAYTLAKSKLVVPVPATADLVTNPYEHNTYIAGYIGFLNPCKSWPARPRPTRPCGRK